MCVLIVDDSSDATRCLQSLLTARGYPHARTAASGQEALEFLEAEAAGEKKIGVVLTDVDMPGLSGIELCQRIKAAPHLRDLSVLVLTGNTDEETLERAFAAGACDFIAKPVSPTELLARVRSAVNLKRELDNCKARERQLVEVTQQLERLNAELHRLSILDELTGIANRRFFNILFNQEWGRAARAVLPLSIILIDVDFFKNYNDHYGHPEGDKCLARVASTLSSLTRRPGDCVARYGGEEFVVLLAHTGVRGALVVAETLRKSIEELALEHACSAIRDRVTISLGVAAVVPERGYSAEQLLAAADQAVYQAKREGRNCVRAFQGPPEEARATGRGERRASSGLQA